MKLGHFLLDCLVWLLINSLKSLNSKQSPRHVDCTKPKVKPSGRGVMGDTAQLRVHCRRPRPARSTLRSVKAHHKGNAQNLLLEMDLSAGKVLPLCLVAYSKALPRYDEWGYHRSGLALGEMFLANAFIAEKYN